MVNSQMVKGSLAVSMTRYGFALTQRADSTTMSDLVLSTYLPVWNFRLTGLDVSVIGLGVFFLARGKNNLARSGLGGKLVENPIQPGLRLVQDRVAPHSARHTKISFSQPACVYALESKSKWRGR